MKSRHSQAATKLMDYFDVNHYQVYQPNNAMLHFLPQYLKVVKSFNPAVANQMVLFGELILDVALLKGLNNYIDDPLSRAVIDKINSDESRHIAMDFFMTEYFSKHNMSGARPSLKDFTALAGTSRWSLFFFNEAFYKPMAMLDPEQKQLKDIAKRIRRYYRREEVKNNPEVIRFNNAINLLETAPGIRASRALAFTFKKIWGVDLDFLKAGHSDNLLLRSGERDDMANSALAKVLAQTD